MILPLYNVLQHYGVTWDMMIMTTMTMTTMTMLTVTEWITEWITLMMMVTATSLITVCEESKIPVMVCVCVCVGTHACACVHVQRLQTQILDNRSTDYFMDSWDGGTKQQMVEVKWSYPEQSKVVIAATWWQPEVDLRRHLQHAAIVLHLQS